MRRFFLLTIHKETNRNYENSMPYVGQFIYSMVAPHNIFFKGRVPKKERTSMVFFCLEKVFLQKSSRFILGPTKLVLHSLWGVLGIVSVGTALKMHLL